MRTCRLSYLSGVCHEEGKEDRLDELYLEIKNQMLILGCASGQGNKSARWLASSAKASANVLRYSIFLSQLLHSWQYLPKAFRAVVYF